MKENLYAQALDGLDEQFIEEHFNEKNRLQRQKARRTRLVAASAACAALVAVGVGVGILMDNLNVHFDEPVRELGDVVIEKKQVTIHYVTPDGEAAEIRRELSCDAYSIFAAWKEQNGLGEDIRLVKTHTASNGVESYEWIGEYEGEGEGVVSYRPGDKFYLTITLAGSDACFAGEDGQALKESLKKTLSGYTGLTYETVEVVFE